MERPVPVIERPTRPVNSRSLPMSHEPNDSSRWRRRPSHVSRPFGGNAGSRRRRRKLAGARRPRRRAGRAASSDYTLPKPRVRLRCARAVHRRRDDDDPSRQAPSGVHRQARRGARRARRSNGEVADRPHSQPQGRARGHSHRRAEPGRRACQSHVLLEDHRARKGRRAHGRARRGDQQEVRRASPS